jgi:hypothetical protein
MYLGCAVDAVQCRRHDTAGITRTFSARIETCNLHMLKCLIITRYTHWRRCPGLYSEQQGIIGIISVHLLVSYFRECIFEPQGNMFRQKFMQRCIGSSRMI